MSVLIDTTSWIEALRRKGREDVRERVRQLMLDDEAAWCEMIRLELWNGARGDYEKQKLTELEHAVTNLAITDGVWQMAYDVAKLCRRHDQTIPATDILIAACALYHNVRLEHCDSHFNTIFKLWHGEKL